MYDFMPSVLLVNVTFATDSTAMHFVHQLLFSQSTIDIIGNKRTRPMRDKNTHM